MRMTPMNKIAGEKGGAAEDFKNPEVFRPRLLFPSAIRLLTPDLKRQKTGPIATDFPGGRMVWAADLEENLEKLAAPGRDFRAENGVV